VNQDKIKTSDSIELVASHHKASNRVTGLVSGCFDIVHIGHIHLFQFAKERVDTLIIGVDEDQSISKSKGAHRPINSQTTRMEFLSHISLVDYVFPLNFEGCFGDGASDHFWRRTYDALRPSCVISSSRTDRYSNAKRVIASSLGIDFLPFDGVIEVSTTIIENILRHSAQEGACGPQCRMRPND
jgi:cytidyltransferase-like protein